MKHIAILTLHFSLLTLHSSAAVPQRWTVDTTHAQPATFEAYQGETLQFEAALQSAGKPLELSGIAALYWQTNGMGSAYWETTAAVNSNLLSAVWTPEMDVGARVYNCFIGIPGKVYRAAFQLRLRPSPGADPNALPLPTPVIDFAKVRVLNPPWGSGGGGGVDTNAVRDIIREEIVPATNRLNQTLTDALDAKRDKYDLAVYVFTEWTGVPSGFYLEWDEDFKWVLKSDEHGYIKGTTTGSKFDLIVHFASDRWIGGYAFTAKRYLNKTADTLATTNGVNEAIAESSVFIKTGGSEDDPPIRFSLNAPESMSFFDMRKTHLNHLNRISFDGSPEEIVFYDGTSTSKDLLQILDGKANHEDLAAKQDALPYPTNAIPYAAITDAPTIPVIDATDPTFSNEVATVARTVTPQPSPTLRLFDEVRQCYWIGKMVNGVINWEVE